MLTFTSPTFLFLFLPLLLIVFWFADNRYRRLIALLASLIFYSWGHPLAVFFLLTFILMNYLFGRQLERLRGNDKQQQRLLILGVTLNIAVLVLYKTSLVFHLPVGAWVGEKGAGVVSSLFITLGLSYICFQAVAYLFDIYNEITDSESDFLGFALYLAFFPKIIAGPITRYRDIVEQLHHPQLDRVSVANGIRRFIIGIAKKVLIADVVGQIVTPAFGLSAPTFSTGIAWLALAAFAIQLYFDFSGYTDMAIGLGQMLGFRLPENFNAPYLSRSITEFWRRWHISLSSWFRDYVFTPLEFKRRKVKTLRQQSNILFVFLLTGLWHGFTLNFIVWGLLHGAAIALESTAFGKWLRRSWAPLQHVYAMGIVLISWVFFRSPDLLYALRFTKRLLGFGLDIAAVPYSLTKPLPVIENSVWLALVMGLVFILPVGTWLKRAWQYLITRYQLPEGVFLVVADVILLVLLVAAVATTAGLTQQSPNIYAVF